MKKLIVFLLVVTAVNALVAGALFVWEPSGSAMGMDVSYLGPSPFDNYFIPGMVLFFVNGVMNIVAAMATLRNHRWANRLVVLQGILLVGWILAQVWMVRDINLLHAIMFFVGVTLMILAYLKGRRER
jgi:hypothetical protein